MVKVPEDPATETVKGTQNQKKSDMEQADMRTSR